MTSAKLSFLNKGHIYRFLNVDISSGGDQSSTTKLRPSCLGVQGGLGNALQGVSLISGGGRHQTGGVRARDLAWQVQRQPDAARRSLELRGQVHRGVMVWNKVLEGSIRQHQAWGPVRT